MGIFTVCGLLYGDYPELARRLLTSWGLLASGDCQFRLGLNAVSPETQAVVDEFVDGGILKDANIWRTSVNIHKYPLMRRMLYYSPVETPAIMWFDDDSYVLSKSVLDVSWHWLSRNRAEEGASMVGAILYCRLGGKQSKWIADQPWSKRPVPARERVRFIVGGWWGMRTEVLYALNWPWPDLDHRGGDVMLGAAMSQQDYDIKNLPGLVAINADESGKNHKAKRRGFNSPPIGWHYDPDKVRA